MFIQMRFFLLFSYMRYGVTVTMLRVDAPVNEPRHVTDAVLDGSSISTANCTVAMLTVGDVPPRTVLTYVDPVGKAYRLQFVVTGVPLKSAAENVVVAKIVTVIKKRPVNFAGNDIVFTLAVTSKVPKLTTVPLNQLFKSMVPVNASAADRATDVTLLSTIGFFNSIS